MPKNIYIKNSIKWNLLSAMIGLIVSLLAALTSDNRSGDVTRAKELGLSTYLVKPVRHANLLEIIRSVTVINDTKQNVNALPVHSTPRASENLLPIRFKNFVPAFLDEVSSDLKFMREALNKDDLKSISTLAHKLKGIGGGFGFGLITDIGKSLEASSKNNILTISRH